jgi:hypothetical protein
MIRRSVYVRHLFVSGVLMAGMLLLMGRGRAPVETLGQARPVSRSSAPAAAPKAVPAAITLSANLPD